MIRQTRVRKSKIDDSNGRAAIVSVLRDPHATLEEMQEVPDTVRSLLRGRLVFKDGRTRLQRAPFFADGIDHPRRIVIVTSRTALHLGLMGRNVIERLTGLPVDVETVSEWSETAVNHEDGGLVIPLSVTAESPDTIAASLGEVSAGWKMVSVAGHSMSSGHDAEDGAVVCADQELGLTFANTFAVHTVGLVLFGLWLGRQRGLSKSHGKEIVRGLARLPSLLDQVVAQQGPVKHLASAYADFDTFLIAGAGHNAPLAVECALAFREVGAVVANHENRSNGGDLTELFPDGSGPVTIESYAPEKTLLDIEASRSSGSATLAIACHGFRLGHLVDDVLEIPPIVAPLSLVVADVAVKLLGCHIGILRGGNQRA